MGHRYVYKPGQRYIVQHLQIRRQQVRSINNKFSVLQYFTGTSRIETNPVLVSQIYNLPTHTTLCFAKDWIGFKIRVEATGLLGQL